jgi:hypothetical protein
VLLNKSDNAVRKSEVQIEEALMDLYIGLRNHNSTQANIIEQERQFDTRVSMIRQQQPPQNMFTEEDDASVIRFKQDNEDYDYILPDSAKKEESPSRREREEEQLEL